MIKNPTIEIKAIQNGYIVELNYQTADDWISEKYAYGTWADVVTYVTGASLPMPAVVAQV